eukprot:TRINITY_DN14430_c0_g1_i1.p2 TRINITY_DN14430_c0_g1~~TRINITY_DN14430_c0_g1_i1.p2  ORF type:complete len:180 (+),score=25.14 TRINITY_DN14430_c0_g1_i1:81-620(+)
MFRQLLEVRKAGKSNINDWSWHAWNLALACTPAGLLWVGLEQVREEIEELEKDTKMDKIRPAEVVTEMQERETRIADQNRSMLNRLHELEQRTRELEKQLEQKLQAETEAGPGCIVLRDKQPQRDGSLAQQQGAGRPALLKTRAGSPSGANCEHTGVWQGLLLGAACVGCLGLRCFQRQ